MEKGSITIELFNRYMRCKKAGYFHEHKNSLGIDVHDNQSDVAHFKEKCKLLLLDQEGVDENGNKREFMFGKEFVIEEIYLTPDALVKCGNDYILVKLKFSSSLVSDYDLWELAFQTYVLKGFDITIKEFWILSINKRYEWNGKLSHAFLNGVKADKEVRKKMYDIPKHLKILKNLLGQNDIPNVRLGQRCEKHYCPFIDRCYPFHKSKLKISEMGFSNKITLPWEDIKRIEDIPSNTNFNKSQWRELGYLLKTEIHRDASAIREKLSKVVKSPNAIFLHMTGTHCYLPIFEKSRPYEILFYQYDYVIAKLSLREAPLTFGKQNSNPMIVKDALIFYENFILDMCVDLKAPIVVFDRARCFKMLDVIKKVLPNLEVEIEKIKIRVIGISEIFSERMFMNPELKGSELIEDIIPSMNKKMNWNILTENNYKELRKDYIYLSDNNTAKAKLKVIGATFAKGLLGIVIHLKEETSLRP